MSPQLVFSSLFSVLALGLLCLSAERLASPPAPQAETLAVQAEPRPGLLAS